MAATRQNRSSETCLLRTTFGAHMPHIIAGVLLHSLYSNTTLSRLVLLFLLSVEENQLVKVTRSPQNTERVMGLSLFRRVIPVFTISPFHLPPPTKT